MKGPKKIIRLVKEVGEAMLIDSTASTDDPATIGFVAEKITIIAVRNKLSIADTVLLAVTCAAAIYE